MRRGEHFFGKDIFLVASSAFLLGASPVDRSALLFAVNARSSGLPKASKPSAALSSVASETPMPFRIGETLNYRVAWGVFTDAASVQLTIPERRELFGCGTWHFRASAHTLRPVRSLFTIDDQFDSYTDARTFESRQYETYLEELGQKKDEVLHFLPVGGIIRGTVPVVLVLPGTRDPLGALYALRSVNWEDTPEFRAPVSDGHDVYEMHVRRGVSRETVAVAAGDFIATRLSIQLFQYGKEMDGTHFSLWLAQDAARTPVLMQAELPFGSYRVELTSDSQ
jgi:hypothetical protein